MLFILFSFQYAITSNTILIDEEEDLFSPFHALMTHAVDIIGESFLSRNDQLLVMCSSTGGRLTPSVSDCTKKNVRVGP